jgi:hypothetical protein
MSRQKLENKTNSEKIKKLVSKNQKIVRIRKKSPHRTGTPEQGSDDGRTRWGGEESELLHMIEKKYFCFSNRLFPTEN